MDTSARLHRLVEALRPLLAGGKMPADRFFRAIGRKRTAEIRDAWEQADRELAASREEEEAR